MPVDTSIYGMIKPIDAAGAIEGGMRMRDLIDERKKKAAVQDAYKQGMQIGPDGKVTMDHGLTASALAKGGYGQEAFQAQQQGQGEQQKQMEMAVKNAQFGAQVLGAAKNQAEWDEGLQRLQNLGMDASKLPGEYSPENQRFLVESAMTLSDRLNQQWKQKEFGLKERELDFKGLEAQAKLGKTDEKQKMQAEQAKQSASIVNQDINRAMEIIDNNRLATGGEAAYIGAIPGTAAHNLDRMLTSVKANAAFDKLQAMRAASPTGGALGSVSEREMDLLQAAIGSLDKSLPKEDLKDNLKRVANIQLDIIHGPGQGPKRHQLSFDESGHSLAQKGGGASGGWGMNEAHAAPAQTFKTNQIDWAD